VAAVQELAAEAAPALADADPAEALIEGVVVGELVWLKEVEYGPEL
jgi:hypothetical protein